MVQETEARQAGQVIGGKYLLERVLGQGGMGEVWSAKHTSLQTLVALKFLKGSSASEPEIRSRFELEARVTAQLKTRLAVQVFDYGVADRGEPFLVMELLEGESVAQRLHRFGRFTPANALNLLAQAGRALEKAHALGIVHRDFKPGNIFITIDEDYREQVKVMDFGLAKIMGELEVRSTTAAPLDDDASPSAFTRTGALLGTPSYMSPEQVAGSTLIGPATDLWALGVVAFECLTGQVPFTGKRMGELFESIRGARHVKGSVLVPELGDAFDQWFAHICAIDPSQRYPSPMAAIGELATALGVSVGSESGPINRAALNSWGGLQAATPMPHTLTPAPRAQPLDGEGSEPTLRRGTTPPPSQPFVQQLTVPQPAPIAARPRGRVYALVGAGLALGVAVLWVATHGRHDEPTVTPMQVMPPPALVDAPAAPPAVEAPRVPQPPPPLPMAPPALPGSALTIPLGGPPPGAPPPPPEVLAARRDAAAAAPPMVHRKPAPAPKAAAPVAATQPSTTPAPPPPEPVKPKPSTGIEHTMPLGINGQ